MVKIRDPEINTHFICTASRVRVRPGLFAYADHEYDIIVAVWGILTKIMLACLNSYQDFNF